jgi:lysine decarboxylase
MTLWFFEYALGLAEEIATRIGQYTREYHITPPFTKALFNYVQEGKYTFCTPGHMGGSAYQKARWAVCFMIFWREYPKGRRLYFRHRAGIAARS